VYRQSFRAQAIVKRLLVCVVLIATSGAAHALSEWTLHRTDDGKHPDAREQAMLWLMNRARQDPSAEGRWLANSPLLPIAHGRTAYQINRPMLIREFDAIEPAPPAAFDARLYDAAVKHARDQIARDVQDHEGQLQKVTQSGVDWNSCRGNVFSYASSPLNTHAAFNIDWGVGPGGMQPDRGHRKALMATDRQYSNVGLAALAERDESSRVGELVVVGNYCSYFTNSDRNNFNRFIVGTVWSDINNSGRYEPGEGVAGVSVVPSHGPYYAVTSAGGGYAIPIRANIDVEISFTGAGIPTGFHDARIDLDSVLIDYQFDDDDTGSSGGNVEGGNSTPGPEIQLAVGRRDNSRYGWKFGSREHQQEVVFNFEHEEGADYELQVSGFDIDNRSDVDVFVNDSRIASLTPTQINTAGVLNRFVVANQILRVGNNQVRFVKNRPGERWGVSRILLMDRTGPVLSLAENSSDTGVYGFGPITRTHPVVLRATFNESATDLSLKGIAENIDFDGEVWIYLNGRRLSPLPITGDDGSGAFEVTLPRRRQTAGDNEIEFRVYRAFSSWRVSNLQLRERS